MSDSILHEIESRIDLLSAGEKHSLLERLAHDLRQAKNVNTELAATLESMAADPDIQREIREIEQEFAGTAEDGLENL